MVEEIYKMKNELLQQAEKELAERGPERIDVNRMDKLVDMVKDLAEAEKSCWEAAYYRKVTEAMEGSAGYATNSNPASGGGNMARQGYGMNTARQGYNSMGYGSMGHTELIDKLGEEFRSMKPEDRMMMKNKILTMMGSV